MVKIQNRDITRELARSTVERLKMNPKLIFEYSLNALCFTVPEHNFQVVMIAFPYAINNSKKERFEELIQDAFKHFEET